MYYRSKKIVVVAVIAAYLLVGASCAISEGGDEADASTSTYYIKLNIDGTATYSTDGTYYSSKDHIGSSSNGAYTSIGNTNSGSWAWGDDGYGPFNSFYAAFDATNNNKMVAHLDPDNLSMTVSGKSLSYYDSNWKNDYNIMWVIPTVYWYTSGGSLILTNDSSRGTAYAHTLSGHTYSYIAIGVYQGNVTTVSGKTVLTSMTDKTPTTNLTRSDTRDYASNGGMNVDGNSTGVSSLWNFYQWELYKYCAVSVMGGWDSQSIAGNGVSYKSSGQSGIAKTTGATYASGPYSGTRGSSTSYCNDSVKVFIENAWGGVFQYVDGALFEYGSGSDTVYIDTSAKPSDSTSGTYVTRVGGISNESGWGDNLSTNVYIWGMPTGKKSSESSSSTKDRFYPPGDDDDGKYAIRVGGQADSDSERWSYAGLSYVSCDQELSVSEDSCGRLTLAFDTNPSICDVTFDSDGGSAVTFQHVVSTAPKATKPADPTKSNLEIKHWYLSTDSTKSEYDFNAVLTSDITLKALWQATVTFDSSGGSAVESLKVIENGTATAPENPTKADLTFKHWYLSTDATKTAYEFTTPVAGNITLMALWEAVVSFDSGDGSAVNPITVNEGDTIEKPEDPTLTHYAFDGWYLDTVEFDFSTPITTNIELVAKWKLVEHVITLDTNGGVEITDTLTVPVDSSVDLPIPTYVGMTFLGWFLGEDLVPTTGYIPVGDAPEITLKADWTVTIYEITLESTKGGRISLLTLEVPHGTAYSVDGRNLTIGDEVIIATPHQDYEFKGWSVSSGKVTSKMTITASFGTSGQDPDDDTNTKTKTSTETTMSVAQAACVIVGSIGVAGGAVFVLFKFLLIKP